MSEARFRQQFQALGLRYFTADEVLYLGDSHHGGGRCAGLNELPPDGSGIWANLLETAIWCEAVRCRFGSPVRLSSIYRAPLYNRCVGGASRSQHLMGTAADMQPLNGDVAGLWAAAIAVRRDHGHGGAGRYRTFVHLDHRAYYATWGSGG